MNAREEAEALRELREVLKPVSPSANGATPRQPGKRATVNEVISRTLGAVEKCGHDELLDMDLPPPSWLVSELVADDGLTWLGGKKKLGKSWLLLQIAVAVATGGTVLGRQATRGSVAYLCLEDGRRRLKDRLMKQQAPRGLPITWYTRFPSLDGDGMGALLELLDEHRPRLLIIDTLAAAKTGKTDENEAGGMADLGNALRGLGQVYHAGILCSHHHGKMTGGDPGHDLRGSSAIGGAGDVNLGIYEESGGCSLRGEGRDIDKVNLPVQLDAEHTWSWLLREDGRQRSRLDADSECLQALSHLGEASSAGVADYLGKDRKTVADRLNRLVDGGMISVRDGAAVGRGRPTLLYSAVFRIAPEPEIPD